MRFILVNREMRKMEIIHYFSITLRPQFSGTDLFFLRYEELPFYSEIMSPPPFFFFAKLSFYEIMAIVEGNNGSFIILKWQTAILISSGTNCLVPLLPLYLLIYILIS